MENTKNATIKVSVNVKVPIDKVWTLWTEPDHIIKWNNASDDWHTPHATNDLKAGGKFSSRMEAKDGSMGFDFGGVYDQVRINEYLAYTLDDERKVEIYFRSEGNSTLLEEIFEPEQENTIELQQSGWQAILENFKRYAENFE